MRFDCHVGQIDGWISGHCAEIVERIYAGDEVSAVIDLGFCEEFEGMLVGEFQLSVDGVLDGPDAFDGVAAVLEGVEEIACFEVNIWFCFNGLDGAGE